MPDTPDAPGASAGSTASASPAFILSSEDLAGPWRAELEWAAGEATVRVRERLGLGLDAPPTLRSIAPEKAFYAALGMKPHNILAVAEAGENLTIINRSAFIASDRAARVAVLTHEFSHLVVGRRIPGGVPHWLDEGLAMVAEKERGFGYHTRIMIAASLGGIQSLDSLWTGVDAVDQELAYAESLSATRHLLLITTGDSDNPEALVRRLASRSPEGAAMRGLLRDPNYLRSFEARWRDSLKSIWTYVGALTGSGAIWGLASLALVLAWWRKRRMARLKEREWREEDRAGRGWGDGDEDGADEWVEEEDERW